MASKKISEEVRKLLEEISLDSLGPKLDSLGVRDTEDLALVDDADLVRWGLSTQERRRFFVAVKAACPDAGDDADLGFLPPSALTTTTAAKQSGNKSKTRNAAKEAAMGPAALDELLGRGSAEYQLPRLAERMLAATGPQEVAELAERLKKAAPALATGYNEKEWPLFVEAALRGYSRLSVEDGPLATDQPIVSIRSSVLFSVSEEVISDTAVWLRVAFGLATPSQVAILATLCRASREVADGPAVWGTLLKRWYPKATLLNPDYIAQADLEKRLEEALDNDYTLAALTRRLENDVPLDIGDLIKALPQATSTKALIKFMSTKPDNFRQSPDGKKFAVCLQVESWKTCKEWRPVNPFQKVEGPAGLEDKKAEAKPAESSDAPQICQQLDPKQAFRLYHTGLLSQRSDQSKRGKLEAWEYFTESNAKCVMAPSDLLNLAESRSNSIRSNDPAVVHELVAQTLEGVVYKVPFGYWNRRVRILTNSLNASQLRVGREQRKKYERKLIEFMEWVKKERGFGFYQCESCGSRWKSGFSYEEIMQQCLQCGAWAKPYRIQDLEAIAEREAREKGEPYVKKEARPSPDKGGKGKKGYHKGKGEGKGEGKDEGKGKGSARSWAGQGYVPAQSRPQLINFSAPSLSHTEGKGGGKRPLEPAAGAGGSAWERNLKPRTEGPTAPATSVGGGRFVPPKAKTPSPAAPKAEPPKASAPAPAASTEATPAAGAAAADAAPSTTSGVRYSAGGGGFFTRKRAGEIPTREKPASSSAAPAETPAAKPAAEAAAASAATPAVAKAAEAEAAEAKPAEPKASYSAGGGGFFAKRRAQADAAKASAPAPAEAAPAAAEPKAAEAKADEKPAAEAYKPGGGGFFAKRRAAPASTSSDAAAPAAAEASASSSAAAAAAPDAKEEKTAEEAAPAISADKMEAIKTLGLSLAEAAAMGLIPASAVPGAAKSDDKAPAKRKAEADTSADGVDQQEKERRKAAAARFAARKAGDAEAAKAAAVDTSASAQEIVVASDESIIDALSAAVKFIDPLSGVERIFSPQASDVAYLISDAIFWSLIRRLTVEITTLEAGKKDVAAFWKDAPMGSEGAVKYAESRGYSLPEGLEAPASSTFWRKGLLSEVATDVLMARMQAGYGFDLPALAGPAGEAQSTWAEKPVDALEGIASAVDAAASVPLAEGLVKDLGATVKVETAATDGSPLVVRLAKVVTAALAAGVVQMTSLDASDAPALKTGSTWSLLQEMGVREQALKLRNEYSVRRQILLRRLDTSVQAVQSGERAQTPSGQRKVADVLSRMWSGWRRNIPDAPPLSEWSALAVTRGIIANAVRARVTGPGSRVNSAVKSILIGSVPDRGGIPDGYKTDRKMQGTAQASAPPSQPAAKKAKKDGSAITTVSTGTKDADGNPAASSSTTPAAEGGDAAAQGGDAAAAGSSDGAAAEPKVEEPISSKTEEKKGTADGARSVNKDMLETDKADKKKERDDPNRKSTYWEEMAAHRK